MKKVAMLLAAAVMIFPLFGCGGKETNQEAAKSQ